MSTFCLAIAIFAFVSIIVDTFRLGISPMPTSSAVRKTLFKHLPKTVDGNIYELGSGWGQIAFRLAKRYPKNQVIAYERALIPYLFSKYFYIFQPNLTFKRVDFRKAELKNSALIYCYLYPGAMRDLNKAPLRGTLWSNTFQLPENQYTSKVECSDPGRTALYIYVV